eukprot:161110_1
MEPMYPSNNLAGTTYANATGKVNYNSRTTASAMSPISMASAPPNQSHSISPMLSLQSNNRHYNHNAQMHHFNSHSAYTTPSRHPQVFAPGRRQTTGPNRRQTTTTNQAHPHNNYRRQTQKTQNNGFASNYAPDKGKKHTKHKTKSVKTKRRAKAPKKDEMPSHAHVLPPTQPLFTRVRSKTAGDRGQVQT